MADPGFAPHVDRSRVPEHVGIILDGNGRWADARGLHRTAGHARGEPALFDVIEGAIDLGVKWLTAYVFSTENWARDVYEVQFLMHFNIDLLRRRRDEMNEKGVRIIFIGERDDPRVPDELRQEIRAAEELTKDNDTLHLIFAFNYGGRVELAAAARRIAEEAAAGLTVECYRPWAGSSWGNTLRITRPTVIHMMLKIVAAAIDVSNANMLISSSSMPTMRISARSVRDQCSR